MKTMAILVPSAITLMLAGCSFRAGTLEGEVERLTTFGHFSVNQPIHIQANARFVGAVSAPSLSVRPTSTDTNVIQVTAYAQRAQPFMGLGIFPVDTSSPQVVEVKATVSVERAGIYIIEGVSAETGRVTATASLMVD